MLALAGALSAASDEHVCPASATGGSLGCLAARLDNSWQAQLRPDPDTDRHRPNKRAREVLVHKEMPSGEVKQVHEDLNEVLEEMIANGKYVLDPVAEKMNHTRYKKFREELRESERIKGKLYAEQKSAVKRKLMDNVALE